jgi:2-polyprenyl-3-methyl-5-hydroxy-6-metoxy-1,4-benzoquinol methylase
MLHTTICRPENARIIKSVSTDIIAEQWQESFGIDVGESFKRLRQIDLWQCSETTFEWYTPVESAGTGELYSKLAGLDWYYMPEKWEFSKALEYLSEKDTMLEVGSGFGDFLDMARRANIKVSGVEISSKARIELEKKGYRVYGKGLGELSGGGLLFDAICAFQVLEHDPKPVQLLDDMKNLVKVGGRLIISVPNADVMRFIDPKRENIMNQPPHHMSHWGESVFRSLEKDPSIRIVEILFEPLQKYHVNWFVISYFRSRWRLVFSNDESPIVRFLFNQFSLFPITAVLKLGLRRFLRGHTLLAVLERVQ